MLTDWTTVIDYTMLLAVPYTVLSTLSGLRPSSSVRTCIK